MDFLRNKRTREDESPTFLYETHMTQMALVGLENNPGGKCSFGTMTSRSHIAFVELRFIHRFLPEAAGRGCSVMHPSCTRHAPGRKGGQSR